MLQMKNGGLLCLTGLLILVTLGPSQRAMSQALRDFTVSDEIGLAHFGDLDGGEVEPTTLSPNRQLVAVHTERGLIKENRVQDEMRVYELGILQRGASEPDQGIYPKPLWTLIKSTYKEGPIISSIRWLPDSTGLAFLVRMESGTNQLWMADLRRHMAKPLTPPAQEVTAFDVHDANHFVYTVRNPGPEAEMMNSSKASAFPATGMSLYGPLLISSDDPETRKARSRSELWAVNGAKPFLVKNGATGRSVILYLTQQRSLSLSPDGGEVAFALPVEDVPKQWETQYPPPAGQDILRMKSGHQDLDSAIGAGYVSAYVVVDLHGNRMSVVTNAPTGGSAGWSAIARPAWSDDSHALVLPGTFSSDHIGAPPCVAVTEPAKKTLQCLEPVGDSRREGVEIRVVNKVRFAPGADDRIVVDYIVLDTSRTQTTNRARIFTRTAQGDWEAREQTGASPSVPTEDVVVRQGLNDPPMLVFIDHSTQRSKLIWDPNPQLKQIRLGMASVYHWKDQSGRQWTGGLYKPIDYTPARRYPLVIQTHGFLEGLFRPSGAYPTAFAARALAAKGIVVLQVSDCPVRSTMNEAPCQVLGYESAVTQLALDGVIDPDRVGIIGFSRTCFYVMQALTSSNLRLRATSITDGVNQGYWQYLLMLDTSQGTYQRDAEAVIGASPAGAGWQQWLQRSPEFNLDKVNSPVQVVATRGIDVLFNWEPYAGLRVLRKPVDLLVLNTSQHVLTNPGARLASQGGTVDWFRFWLKDEEDPDPAKAGQYRRWHDLRKLQEENEKRPATRN